MKEKGGEICTIADCRNVDVKSVVLYRDSYSITYSRPTYAYVTQQTIT